MLEFCIRDNCFCVVSFVWFFAFVLLPSGPGVFASAVVVVEKLLIKVFLFLSMINIIIVIIVIWYSFFIGLFQYSFYHHVLLHLYIALVCLSLLHPSFTCSSCTGKRCYCCSSICNGSIFICQFKWWLRGQFPGVDILVSVCVSVCVCVYWCLLPPAPETFWQASRTWLSTTHNLRLSLFDLVPFTEVIISSHRYRTIFAFASLCGWQSEERRQAAGSKG